MLFDDLTAPGGQPAPSGVSSSAGSLASGGGMFDDLVPAQSSNEQPGLTGAFTGAVKRGLQQTWGLAREGLPALVYSAMGNTEEAQGYLDKLSARFAEAEKANPTIIKEIGDVDSPMKAAYLVAEALGENIPSLVPGLGAAGVGAGLGRAAVRKGATEAAEVYAKRQAVGTAVGVGTGAVAGSAVQNIPETFADVAQETGQQRPDVAMIFGGLKASLDAIPTVLALKRAFGPAITDKIAGNILKRMGVGAAEQFVAEGATEGAQEGLDIAAARYVDQNKEKFTPENVERMAFAGLKGGIGGAGLGAISGAIGRRAAPEPEPPPPEPPEPMLALPSPTTPRPMTPDEITRARAAMGVDWEPSEPNVSKDRFPLGEPVKAQATADNLRKYRMPDEAAPADQASDKYAAYQGPVDPNAEPVRDAAKVAPPPGAVPVSDLPQTREAQEAFRLAGIAKAKGQAYAAARHYIDLTDKIGEDPGQLVERTLQIPAAQFQAMPIPARDQIIQVALKARDAQQPGKPMQVQDTSGQGPTSAAPAPMEAARQAPFRGAAENPRAPVQPTSAEIEAIERGQPSRREWSSPAYDPSRGYSQQGVGGSERPFPAGQDSSGLDFTRGPDGQPVDPRAGMFEQRAQERAAAAQAAQQEEIRRKQEAYNNAREARRRPNADAEAAYAADPTKKYHATPRDLDQNGDYPIDQWGFVISTGGGPMRFMDGGGKSANQKAALWIKQHGQRRSKYQVFDRANHPSGKGIGIVVTGRNEPPGGAGPGKYGVPARVNPSQPARPSPAAAAGVTPVSPAAPAAGGPTPSAAAPQAAPVSPQEPPAPKPVTDPRPAFAEQIRQMRERDKAMNDLAAVIAGDDDKPVVLADKRQHGALISNDIDEPGKVRLTWFDKDGFSGHTVYNTRQEAIRAALQSGYADTNRNLLREYSRLDTFKQGNERADQVQREAAKSAPKKAAPKPKKGRGPASLWEFIASRGGIKDTDGELRKMGITSKKLVPGAGPLVRKDGLSYDAMREAAEEAGYIRSKDENSTTTPRDLLDAIGREMPYWMAGKNTRRKDTRVYADEDQNEADARREARDLENESRREQMERRADSLGIEYDGSISDADLERLIEAYINAENDSAEPDPSGPYRGAPDLDDGIPGFEPSIDRTEAGDQYVMPGAEKIKDKEMAERRGQKPLRSDAEQKPADEGIFDVEGRKQDGLFSRKKAPGFYSALTDAVESDDRVGSPGGENVGATIQTRPETSEARKQATDSLRAILRKLAGDKVDVAVVDRIVGDDANFSDAGGFYTSDAGRRMIYIAMGDMGDMASILRHETIHALRDLGVISPKDWRALENQAAGWRKKFGIDKSYSGLGMSQEKMNEEGIAEAYAAWVDGRYKPVSVIENVFKQIKAFFEALRNWAQGNGWKTSADVFEAIEGGELSQAEFERMPLNRKNAFALSRHATKNQARGVMDMIKSVRDFADRLSNPLSTLTGWESFYAERGLTKGKIQAIQDGVAAMRDMIGLTGDAREQAMRYMTSASVSPDVIKDPKLRAKFVDAKKKIIDLGRDLVDAGLLPEDVYVKNRGAYLPRLYLKFMLEEDADRRAMGGGAKPGNQGYLKNRKDIPEDIRKILYGEIDDPGFLAARSISVVASDLAKLQLLQHISTNSDWVAEPRKQLVSWRGKNYTPQGLKAQSDSLRTRIDQMPAERREAALKMADDMDKVALEKLRALPRFSEDYKQIPDNKRWGHLRGLWVRKEIYNDMQGTFAIPNPDPSWPEQILGMGGWGTKITQAWKTGKVVLNPPSVVRNLMSGVVQSNVFGQVPIRYLPKRYWEAGQDIAKGGKYWKIYQKFGGKGSAYAQNEMARINRDFLALQKARGGTPGVRNMARFKDFIAFLADKASDGYQLVETIGKVAVITDAMERRGLSEAQAMIEAENAQFDYSNVTPAIRYLRNSPVGMPFVTYMSKVLPQLLKTAVTRPMAFTPYAALAIGLPMLFKQMEDIDDEEWKKLNKTLPAFARENGVYLLPLRDSAGRWHYLDLNYIMPWGMMNQAWNKTTEGKPGEALKGIGLFGAPLFGIATAMTTGIDPFTNRPITQKGDPPWRQYQDRMLYAMGMAMPPWLAFGDVNGGWAKKLWQAANNEAIDRRGNPTSTMTQALGRVFGINLYGLDPEVDRQKNLAQMKYEIDEIKRRRGTVAKDARLKPDEKKEYIAEINAHLNAKAKEMAEYARTTNVAPKLKVAQ
jgi:hypothetical protein